MNKRISDMMGMLAGEIELEESVTYDPEKILSLTMDKIQAEKRSAVHPRHKLWRTLLIAAALLCLLSVTAFAAGYFKLEVYEPEDEVYVRYNPAGPDRRYENVAMILRYDVAKTGNRARVRLNWLPQEENAYPEYEPDFPWVENQWYKIGKNDGVFCVEYGVYMYNGSRLYKKDLAIGAEGGLAIVEKQWADGEWQIMEVSLDETGIRPVNQINHFLLMFNTEHDFLVSVCGFADYEILEKIAGAISYEMLDEVYEAEEPKGDFWNVDWLAAGMG